MNYCKKCNLSKPYSEFGKDSRRKSGLKKYCKKCVNKINTDYRDNNPEKVKVARKKHYHDNIEKMRQSKRDYYRVNKDKKKVYDKEYRKLNKESIAKYKKEWEYNQRLNNPLFKIKNNIRRRISHALNGNSKSKSTIELLGCSPEEFKIHIESQFDKGMSWDNYGKWHIDHIKPCYTFDLSIPEQQKECFHFSNQRPLWAKDNLSRSKNILLSC